MPSLKWMAPKGPPKVYPIFKKITSIGRGKGNDVRLDDGSLSEFHAQIVFDGRDFNLAEVDRSASIQINGKKKRRGKIFHNDALTVGDIELVFSVYDEGVEKEDTADLPRAELQGMRRLVEFSEKLNGLKSVQEQLEALV
ncbi:MAG: FHA domain-containing protein, partial [Myxococcota bacterium]